MTDDTIDHIDKGILFLLQENARNNTTSAIGEKVGVASSTVGNRIKKLEESGVITGYYPAVDYRKAGLDHHVLVVGTVPFDDRGSVVEAATGVDGVVRVQEMLSGRRNVSVELIAETPGEVEQRISELTDCGIDVERVEMVDRNISQPFDHFGEQFVDDE